VIEALMTLLEGRPRRDASSPADEPDDTVLPPRPERLVDAALTGDPQARERLLTEVRPFVLRYCRGRMGHHGTPIGSADEVAEQVCLAVVDALPGYAITDRPFPAFVHGIAARTVLGALRSTRRDHGESVAGPPGPPVVRDGDEQRLAAVELTERLGRLLLVLPACQREPLLLRIAVGMSVEETAQAVGSTPDAVRLAQHRALNRLRRSLLASNGRSRRTVET
jgi:RNA polymerase sigma-70 factor, ECF subfamily